MPPSLKDFAQRDAVAISEPCFLDLGARLPDNPRLLRIPR
jgi:hypothetical protein